MWGGWGLDQWPNGARQNTWHGATSTGAKVKGETLEKHWLWLFAVPYVTKVIGCSRDLRQEQQSSALRSQEEEVVGCPATSTQTRPAPGTKTHRQPKATANAAMENAEKARRNSTCHIVIAPEKLLSCYNPH